MGVSAQSDFVPIGESVLCAPQRRSQVAALNRLLVLWVLDGKFHDAYLAEPERALADTGLDVDPRAASLILLGRLPEGSDGQDELPESFVWYRDFIEARFASDPHNRLRDMPTDPRFRDWRERQVKRCEREMGSRARLMSHQPVTFELSLGCSMTCSFCGLSAGRLEGVFRHTHEHAKLWRDVMARLHALVGDAAGAGTCYCANEPLDNPDYELFLEDFYKEFGRIPQTTTAAATRDITRTRRLLAWGQETSPHFDRISVLSACERDILLASFTPDELLYTDLLPQFAEAPGYNLQRAGRNLGDTTKAPGTISCVSGFVVNMYERSIRLETPVIASDEHPTGVLVYEKAFFADGADLEEAARRMIDRHMHETVSLKGLFGRFGEEAQD